MSSTSLNKLNFPDLLYVAENMHEWDKREIYAGRWTEDPYDFAQQVDAMGAVGFISYYDGKPVSVVCAYPMSPTLWNVIMFSTSDFEKVWFDTIRYIKRFFIPAIVSTGALRAECRSMDGHVMAHRWLECIGFRNEGINRMVGKHGEDFYVFAFTKDCLQTDS